MVGAATGGDASRFLSYLLDGLFFTKYHRKAYLFGEEGSKPSVAGSDPIRE
jgi:hypothetical protein